MESTRFSTSEREAATWARAAEEAEAVKKMASIATASVRYLISSLVISNGETRPEPRSASKMLLDRRTWFVGQGQVEARFRSNQTYCGAVEYDPVGARAP